MEHTIFYILPCFLLALEFGYRAGLSQREYWKDAESGGALKGLVIDNISGGSGSKEAAAGTAIGGVGSEIRSSKQNQAQQQATAQSQAHFNRAYSACLEGRGYTIK